MIRIAPYFRRENGNDILTYYLNLVADVVPFLTEDVLDGVKIAEDSLGYKARKRTKRYLQLLEDNGIPDGTTPEEQRCCDAKLARELVKNYSVTLYQDLYNGMEDDNTGAVNRTSLRELLTVFLKEGIIPDRYRLEDKGNSDAAKQLYDYVFCYDSWTRKNGKRNLYQLVAMMEVNVCPYCNRQFITTVPDGERRVRPQLDHFRNKADYPYLALSINNLIPCCNVCNLLKHDRDEDLLYPYDEEMGDDYVFRAKNHKDDIISLLTGTKEAKYKFDLVLERQESCKDESLSKRADASIRTLALRDLYQAHKDYVADLFYQRYVFTDDLLDDIKKQFPDLFGSREDVKRMLFLMDSSPEKWGQRPLAKLTHDIEKQIDELYIGHGNGRERRNKEKIVCTYNKVASEKKK